MNTPLNLRPLPLLAAIALAWPLASVHAQTTPAAEAGKLQTVTVTAERRAENIKDVPSSISVLSGEALDVLNSGGQDLRALAGRVPSVNVESTFGRAFPRFYLRGYGNTDFRLNASQPVSLVYDDVVQENPILKGFPAFDLSRIEVLAGPQGTLFGRNTPGGVVKFESVQPSNKKTEGYFNASYGTYGTTNLETGFNLPLSGDWSMRVSALAQHRDNWVSNSGSGTKDLEGYDDRAIRLQAGYNPAGGDFSALFNVHSRDLKGSARLFRANIIKPGTNDLVDGFDPAKVNYDGLNSQKLSSTGGSMKLKWALSGLNVYSITGYETVDAYSRGDIDGGNAPYAFGTILFPVETADGIRDHAQFTQEFRVESRSGGPLNWQAGVYLYDEKFTMDAYSYNSTAAGNPQDGKNATTQTNTSSAVFGSVKYDISKDWNVRAGLRFTQDKKDLSTTAIQGTITTSNGTAHSTSDANTSWDLSTTYKLSADTSVYGRIATGYRGSSIQPASAFGAMSWANPETITSYEAGVKSDLWDRRARTAFSVYSFTVKDQQLTVVGGGTNTTALLNAKESNGSGIEWTFDAFLSDNFRVGLAASYNDTKINDASLTVPGCGLCGLTVENPTNGAGNILINGNPLPNAPKTIFNVNARYGMPMGNSGELYVYTDWAYRSEANALLYQSKEFKLPALLEGGLRVGYIWADGKYEVAGFARNVTNTIRNVGVIDINNKTGMINDPRTYGVQFKATF